MRILPPFLKAILSSLFLMSCGDTVSREEVPQILTMGDSLLSTNSLGGQSVPDNVERFLGQPVIDRSVPGARISYILPITGSMGLNIGKQYAAGNWDWIILNGGGNDLVFGCGCNKCERKMNQLITEDGSSGKITALVRKLRATGAQVVYVGYLRSPGLGSPIEGCKNEGDELERRIALLADADNGIHFLSIADMVPYGDRSYHGLDMVHPSTKASKAIASRIAKLIASN